MKKLLCIIMFLVLSFTTGCMSAPYYDSIEAQYNQYYPINNNEEYEEIIENRFINTLDMPVSTFAADVDTASYSIIRRKLSQDILPNKNAIRIEEMLNYFNYNLNTPAEDEKIAVSKELSKAPWNEEHLLLMLGLKTEDISFEESVPSNLVFLLDVSGSMNSADKLPLLKKAIKILVDQLRPIDRISIVVYAGAAGLILDGADGSSRNEIIDALDSLEAGGSTAGEQGIRLAYKIAEKNFIEGGNNRVILATDGDFNVGMSSQSALETFISKKKASGVFLTVLGFGQGNIKDNIMQTLANKGNGVYHYIDSLLEAKKVFMSELGANLLTVAKDVKMQIEFNPLHVKAYRLIGYENRILEYEDFDDDEKDGGEIGAGHEVIVFYEIIPASSEEVIERFDFDDIDELKYDQTNYPEELFTLSIRYKEPDSDYSLKDEHIMLITQLTQSPSERFIFGTCVVEFGLLLRDSEFKFNANFSDLLTRLNSLLYLDEYQEEFITLVEKAYNLLDS